MNRADLIDAIATDANISKQAAGQAIDTMIRQIILSAGSGEVRINGLGTFSAKRREARSGINPLTGKPIKIEAKTVAKFKPSKAFTDHLNA